MDTAESAQIIALIIGAWPRAQFTRSNAEAYELMLADLEYEAARLAIVRLAATSTWVPSIAEIRAAAAELAYGATKSGGEAWVELMGAVRRVGRYGHAPRFDDAVLADIVRRLGWEEVCSMGTDADRARFIELYDTHARRARADLVSGIPLPPAGRHAELAAGITVRALGTTLPPRELPSPRVSPGETTPTRTPEPKRASEARTSRHRRRGINGTDE